MTDCWPQSEHTVLVTHSGKPANTAEPLRCNKQQLHLQTLHAGPEAQRRELRELAEIYRDRGLSPQLAHQVAVELTEKDVIRAHARDELVRCYCVRSRSLLRPWLWPVLLPLPLPLPLLSLSCDIAKRHQFPLDGCTC